MVQLSNFAIHCKLRHYNEGHVTDTQGRTVSFRNSLIIMTSNLGSDEIAYGGQGKRFGSRGRSQSDIKVGRCSFTLSFRS